MAFNKQQDKFFHTKAGAAKLKKKPPVAPPLPPAAAEAPMPAPTAPEFQDPTPAPFSPAQKSNWGGRKPI
jgi:hypothetical protein